jgi:hypothetical protein
MRKSVSRFVLHKELCMDPVAKGWLRSSITLWEWLQSAPQFHGYCSQRIYSEGQVGYKEDCIMGREVHVNAGHVYR